MPKIISYAPSWLSRPSLGSRIFSDQAQQSPQLIKNSWEARGSLRQQTSNSDSTAFEQDEKTQYRILTTPVYYEIRQLVISPSGAFLAICTEHTVHVAILPDSSRLRDGDQSPLKLKSYQLGPTIHVIPESPVVSVLWHPLAARKESTDCLVTVTAEAAVRLWEIDRHNQWSFEKPALAVDLRRLADGASYDEDFEPSGFGKSRGFSVDAFDMEVSAACFGGQGVAEEDPWASMTLWAAMRNGDVYALCPLLPSTWTPSPTTIPALSTGVVSKVAIMQGDEVDPAEQEIATKQYEWIQEIDAAEGGDSDWNNAEGNIFQQRPIHPGAIPKLQGPFETSLSDVAVEHEVSDIFVIPAKLDREELLSGEEDYEDLEDENAMGVPYTVVCLATTDGEVRICLDLEGVSGQWLPKKGNNSFAVPDSQARDLIPIEKLKAAEVDVSTTSTSWPMFTADTSSPFSLFLTTSSRVVSISLADWCSRLALELLSAGEEDPGLAKRLNTICQGKIAAVTEVLIVPKDELDKKAKNLSMPVIFDDTDMGYMLLTSTNSQPYAACFDRPCDDFDDGQLDVSTLLPTIAYPQPSTDHVDPPRPHYDIPGVFMRSSTASLNNLTSSSSARVQQALKQPIKLSPAVLEAMTAAHRAFALQSFQLEKAAAELFRRCERLQDELHEHVKQMAQLADRLQQISEAPEDTGPAYEGIDQRIQKAQDRQKKLAQRFEEVRHKAARANDPSRQLSTKEVAWVDEITTLGRNFGLEDDNGEVQPQPERGSVSARMDTIKQLSHELLEESKTLGLLNTGPEQSDAVDSESEFRRSTTLVSSKIQREKVDSVMRMVDREGAVIDAVMARLERLSVEF